MTADTVKSIVVGSVIALVVFGTVPAAQVLARHGATSPKAATTHPLAERIGAGVTSFVQTNTAMSVALSAASR